MKIYRVFKLQSACAGGNPRKELAAVVGDYVVFNFKNPEVYKGSLHRALRERGYAQKFHLVGKTVAPLCVLEQVMRLFNGKNAHEPAKTVLANFLKSFASLLIEP